MKYIISNFFLVFVILVQTVHAQKKAIFKNQALYLHDPSIYYLEKTIATPRTEHCKELILNKDKNDDGKIKYGALVESKEVIRVRTIFLMGDVSPAEPYDFLSQYPAKEILGPFKTNYGTFRFIEIIRSSRLYPRDWERGETKWINHIMLGKEKAPIKQLKRIANQIVLFYEKGIGTEKNINKKIKKYRISTKNSECGHSKEAEKLMNNAAFCETWHTLECADGVLIIKLQKTKSNAEYVQYDEYIFK